MVNRSSEMGEHVAVIQQSREEIAEMLLGAYASRQPVEPLTADSMTGSRVADAYEIQLLQVRRWLAAGSAGSRGTRSA